VGAGLLAAFPAQPRIWAAGGLAGVSAVAALVLAAQHPLSASLALIGVLAVGALTVLRPHAWLFALPALLPVLSLAPWTGWWLVDESDLFVLAVLAGAYGRRVVSPCRDDETMAIASTREARMQLALGMALLATLLLGVLRGWLDASSSTAVPWAGALTTHHDSAWNTLRVAKSLLWALLLWPLLRASVQAGHRQHLAAGVFTGLLLVGAIVLWERHTYAGLVDFHDAYRTSAAFWEMHVGGGAIDMYLVLAVPFACWALWSAPTRLRALLALLVLALGVYAALTTYSRGVVLALMLALAWMLALAVHRQLALRAHGVDRRGAVLAVALLLAGEAALVLGGGALLPKRLAQSGEDLMGRVAHWQAGLLLLHTPADWLLGLGLGRLPAHYSRAVPGGEFPGQAAWAQDAQGGSRLLLSSPASRGERAADFGLTQRVHLQPDGSWTLRWRATPLATSVSSDAAARLRFSLCERHLLYTARCRSAVVATGPVEQTAVLSGASYVRRGGVLSVSVLGAGQQVQLHSLQLLDPQGRQRLHNSAFTEQLHHWWPIAQGHFQPWHIDNLYLEWLIERGLLGLLVLLAWVVWAARHLRRGLRSAIDAEQRMAWVLSAALPGVLLLGALVSLMDNPRVALLAMLCMWATEPKTQLNCS
jgi:hypothetical protein